MIGRVACLTAAVVITIGQPALAADQTPVRTADIALADGGVLNGVVLTPEAQPVASTKVKILHGTNIVAEAVTNDDGEFAVKGLRNGVHTVQMTNASQPVRFWSATAAPPTANGRLVMVSSPNMVRAQEGAGIGAAGAALIFGGTLAVVLATTLDDKNEPVVSSP